MSLIVIRGPGGAGKSTTSKRLVEILRKEKKVGLIEADSFYWDIAGRDPNPDIMYEGLKRLTDLYLSKGYDFVIGGILTAKDEGGRLRIENVIEVAKDYNQKVLLFHLYAPLEVLRRRELTKFSEMGWDFDEESFASWYDKSINARLTDEIIIDTTNICPNEVVNKMLEYNK